MDQFRRIIIQLKFARTPQLDRLSLIVKLGRACSRNQLNYDKTTQHNFSYEKAGVLPSWTQLVGSHCKLPLKWSSTRTSSFRLTANTGYLNHVDKYPGTLSEMEDRLAPIA